MSEVRLCHVAHGHGFGAPLEDFVFGVCVLLVWRSPALMPKLSGGAPRSHPDVTIQFGRFPKALCIELRVVRLLPYIFLDRVTHF